MKLKLNNSNILLLILSLVLTIVNGQTEKVLVWPNGAPEAINSDDFIEETTVDVFGVSRSLSKVSAPDLSVFLAEPSIANGTAVIICPGGGYTHLAINKEGYKVAKWFNSLGISAFVLKYRMPSDVSMKDKTVGPLQDVQESVRLVRENAGKWHINANKIGVMGFSAGGHLAATAATHYKDNVYNSKNISARPDFSVLIYPVISMQKGITHQGSKNALLGKDASKELIEKYSNEKHIDANTPPTFIIHATDDGAVPVQNSIDYYAALQKNKVRSEMHIYESGGHGFGMGGTASSSQWTKTFENWLQTNDLTPKDEVFLFSYFIGNGEDGLHFAYSDDGYTWKELKQGKSFLTPTVGKDKLMRDPCIIKGGDGNYHMVWTVSWTDKGFGYASSKDLINWSTQQFVPAMAHEKEVRNTWAPEIFYDDKAQMYMIYWASTIPGLYPETQSKKDKGYNHRMYYTTTKDFKTYTDTKLLYEPGFNVIDATIQKQDDNYIMFLKDETREPAAKNLKLAFSKNLLGPYSKATTAITGGYWAEGPTVIKIDNKWVVYFDKYMEKKYGAISSSELKKWKDISEQVSFPEGTRHGTVLKVPLNIFLGLKQE